MLYTPNKLFICNGIKDDILGLMVDQAAIFTTLTLFQWPMFMPRRRVMSGTERDNSWQFMAMWEKLADIKEKCLEEGPAGMRLLA